MRNKEILAANKSWSTWSESKTNSLDSDDEDNIETKSLPPSMSKEWHPTVPKPFSFTLRCFVFGRNKTINLLSFSSFLLFSIQKKRS